MHDAELRGPNACVAFARCDTFPGLYASRRPPGIFCEAERSREGVASQMATIEAGQSVDYLLVARRNNSLSRSERQRVLCFICAVSLTIALGFAAFGAWLVLPFAGLEMVVLYVAFRVIEKHAGDYEYVEISGDRVRVEVREGGAVRGVEFDRHWAQVVLLEVAHGYGLGLRSHGREVELGRHLTDAERERVARELRRHLKQASRTNEDR